MQNILFNFR